MLNSRRDPSWAGWRTANYSQTQNARRTLIESALGNYNSSALAARSYWSGRT